MRFDVKLDDEALSDLKRLRAYHRKAILDTIERVLGADPTRESQSRIKRLRGIDSPQYRLRIGDYRAFYDVDDTAAEVYIFRVLSKDDVGEYLKELGHEDQGD